MMDIPIWLFSILVPLATFGAASLVVMLICMRRSSSTHT